MIPQIKTNKEISKILGKRIFVIRKLKGLSRKSLVQKIHVDARQIEKYEAGENVIDVEVLSKISKALELNIRILIPRIKID